MQNVGSYVSARDKWIDRQETIKGAEGDSPRNAQRHKHAST
jgi:hypothetical protein